MYIYICIYNLSICMYTYVTYIHTDRHTDIHTSCIFYIYNVYIHIHTSTHTRIYIYVYCV